MKLLNNVLAFIRPTRETVKHANSYLSANLEAPSHVLDTPVAEIIEYDHGFALYNGTEFVQSYARRRDAVRGATRRGLRLS